MNDGDSELNRRDFVKTAGLMTGAVVIGQAAGSETTANGVHLLRLDLRVNDRPHQLMVDPRRTLLDLLRENLGLTGTKKGCDHGQCGACTVLVNGRRINSCLSLAMCNDGQEVTTIEGLASGDELHPLQAAFIECDGLQCGYCTPGQICSAVALLREVADGAASAVTTNIRSVEPRELTLPEIRERMSGNICRCGAYPGIVDAVQSVYRHSRIQGNAEGRNESRNR